MGATKMNTKSLNGITVNEIAVESFKLLQKEVCKFVAGENLSAGDTILLKASFKNQCEAEDGECADGEDARVMYRRRVVPFVTRVRNVIFNEPNGRRLVTADIENITASDRKFFYDKFFSLNPNDRASLDIEGKRIVFQT